MIYLQLSDFYVLIQEQELVDIVGPVTTIIPPNTSVGFARLTTLEAMAMHKVQGYLEPRYDTAAIFTAEDRHAIIVQALVDIVLYDAFSRVHPNNVPELRENRYLNTIEYLERIMKGQVAPSLPIRDDEDPDTVTSGPLRFGSSTPKTNSQF